MPSRRAISNRLPCRGQRDEVFAQRGWLTVDVVGVGADLLIMICFIIKAEAVVDM
ncbi:hypothetical protein ALP01_200317 [Pseudomonas caricapapayae]|nr:hypothetical protein ALP01_200317 [Pseudomonas caricapapayae]